MRGQWPDAFPTQLENNGGFPPLKHPVSKKGAWVLTLIHRIHSQIFLPTGLVPGLWPAHRSLTLRETATQGAVHQGGAVASGVGKQKKGLRRGNPRRSTGS